MLKWNSIAMLRARVVIARGARVAKATKEATLGAKEEPPKEEERKAEETPGAKEEVGTYSGSTSLAKWANFPSRRGHSR
jgi:hypothetical protein